MPANINLENYELDTDSNGNLVIRDPNDTTVLTHTAGSGWSFGDEAVTQVGALTTATIDFPDGGFTQEGQLSPELALGGTFNITSNFNETSFGLGIISRTPAIGTALFEFQKFAPRVKLIHDSNGEYTTTQGNSGTTNLYYNSSGDLIAENQNTKGNKFWIMLFSE